MKGILIDISPVVEERTAVFPGDVEFRRQVMFDTQKGQHLTLSSLHSTVHIGAHADAPNHFSESKEGIDEVPLSHYWGQAQVVSVIGVAKPFITVKDFERVELSQPRLLIRTETCVDPYSYTKTFPALTPELIDYLGKKKVILVGVDTPSLDPWDSKTMNAHKVTLKFHMAILEGLSLSNAPDGVYELVALPLRLRGFDASPVRAVLRTL